MSDSVANGKDTGLRVIVVGAGIAGLAAAISLRRQGHTVEIHERSRFKSEIGAGIMLASNVTRLFELFGLEDKNIFPVDSRRSAMFLYDQVENPIHMAPPSQVPGSKEYAHYQTHRVDLHNELKRLAVTEEGLGTPCELTLASQVVDCDPETATVTLASGDIFKGDLLVVAEGVKSTLRNKICDCASEPKISGYYAHRHTLPIDDAFRNDPSLQWILENQNRVTLICDRGTRRIVVYPVRDCTVLNVVALCHVSEAPYLAEVGTGYDSTVPKESVIEAYKGFDERYLYLFKLAAPGGIRAWPLLSVVPLSTWVKGNAVLIGDTAHPMWPFAAQGGAQGLEDAAALSILLPKDTPVPAINSRLRLFEEIRRPRCEALQLNSYAMAEDSPFVKGHTKTEKHFALALTYDVVEIAKVALKTQLEKQKAENTETV